MGIGTKVVWQNGSQNADILFAENAVVLFPAQQKEHTGSHLGIMGRVSLRMMRTPREAQQRDGNKWVLDDSLNHRMKPHLKPVRKQQLELDMEQQTGSKQEKEYMKAVYCHPAYLTSMQSTS